MKIFISILLIAVALGSATFILSKYEVDESNMAVITMFGDVVKSQTQPGIFFKIPFVQRVHYFRNGLFVSKSGQQIPTLEKKFLSIKSNIFWKIADPVHFYKSVYSNKLGDERVLDIVGPAERNIIVQHHIKDIVPDGDRIIIKDEQCSANITRKIIEKAKPHLLKAGIELVSIEAAITYPIK